MKPLNRKVHAVLAVTALIISLIGFGDMLSARSENEFDLAFVEVALSLLISSCAKWVRTGRFFPFE